MLICGGCAGENPNEYRFCSICGSASVQIVRNAARAGVVTGRAAAVDDGNVIVVGDWVNTAARVQSAAEAGQVLVDDMTLEVTRASFAYADAGLFEFRGENGQKHL